MLPRPVQKKTSENVVFIKNKKKEPQTNQPEETPSIIFGTTIVLVSTSTDIFCKFEC